MTNFRTAMIAMAVAAAMAGSQAMAADTLAPGKPAGVAQARHGSPNLLLIGGAAAIAVVGVVVATMGSSDAVCGPAQGCVAAGTSAVTSTTS